MTENTDGMLLKAGADDESVIEINGKYFHLYRHIVARPTSLVLRWRIPLHLS